MKPLGIVSELRLSNEDLEITCQEVGGFEIFRSLVISSKLKNFHDF